MNQKIQHLKLRNSELSDEIYQPQIIDLDISHTCTRKCSFCPQSKLDMSGFMNIEYVKTLAQQLIDFSFQNIICMAGHGEPTCHPDFIEILNLLNSTKAKHIEVISNGDNLINSKVDIRDILRFENVRLTLSAYSEQHYDIMYGLYSDYDKVLIKKMYTKDDLFWSNRGIFETENPHIDNYCYLVFYKLELGMNGNYNLCCQDWSGDMSTDISILDLSYIDAWYSLYKEERDKQLEYGSRVNSVCKRCNVNGTLIGETLFNKWKSNYETSRINTTD